jgi:hypothetical protein
MKIVPYRDTDDMQMKKAILPQTQEEGELIHRAIHELMTHPPSDLKKEDIEDLAVMIAKIEDMAHVNPNSLVS